MSNKTFTMPSDQVLCTVPPPHRNVQLNLSAQSLYRSSQQSLSPSPDFNSSVCNLSDRETNDSPHLSMQECCLIDSSPVDNYAVTLPQGNVLCGVSTNLNQTFIATPVNDGVNYWNVNLSSVCNHEMGSEKYQTQNGCNCAAMSPNSAGRESRLGSCEFSCRGSIENEYCSLSSGEMAIRSNTFCMEDQSLLVVSSLEEASISLTAGHLPLPDESNLLSVTLDVGEKFPEKVTEENAGHPCMTFTLEEDIAASNCLVALPSEKEGGLLMTFVCETSPVDFGKEAHFANNAQLLFPEALTPEKGKSLVSTLSAVPDTDKDIQTSTPIQKTESESQTPLSSYPDPKLTPTKCLSNKIKARTGSALGQGKPSFLKTRSQCLSESSLSSPQLLKGKKTILRFSNSFIIPRADTLMSQTKKGALNYSSQKKQPNQVEPINRPVDKTRPETRREVKKFSLGVSMHL